MSQIFEAILTTVTPEGRSHISPLGFRKEKGLVILAPFYPSRTLENLDAHRIASISHTNDVRVFAACLIKQQQDFEIPLSPCQHISCERLSNALAHSELEVIEKEEDPLRPQFICREIEQFNHAAFPGFNRAQAAIIEACILISRLQMLPTEKIDSEMDYLAIAIEKTAGAQEKQAWQWIKEQISAYRRAQKNKKEQST